MPLDSQDFELLKSIRKALRDGDEITTNMLRQMVDANNKNSAATAAAFNRVAAAMENLTEEIRGLRRDLAPDLEKKKLSPPAPQPKH